MVRLLLGIDRASVSQWENFQSHNGAIAATDIEELMQVIEQLSIPQWCDCCPMGRVGQERN